MSLNGISKTWAATATVGTGYTAIGSPLLLPARMGMLTIELTNGLVQLNGFAVQLLPHSAGTYFDFLVGSNWSSDPLPDALWFVSTDPSVLGASTLARMTIQIPPCAGIKLLAKVASSTSIVSALGTFCEA